MSMGLQCLYLTDCSPQKILMDVKTEADNKGKQNAVLPSDGDSTPNTMAHLSELGTPYLAYTRCSEGVLPLPKPRCYTDSQEESAPWSWPPQAKLPLQPLTASLRILGTHRNNLVPSGQGTPNSPFDHRPAGTNRVTRRGRALDF